MSGINEEFTRLLELKRVRSNLEKYSHYDDLGPTLALALKYVGGAELTTQALQLVRMALDEVIEGSKSKLLGYLDD